MVPARSLLAGIALTAASLAQQSTTHQYIRVGNTADADVKPHAGFALMGGGKDLDEAFKWLCDRASGGDLLILRATGTDAYNPYIQGLCKLNSVATLIIPSHEAAMEPQIAQIISHAGAIFIAGGDQANYINFWMGTPVQSALNDAIRRGVPLGGTSAGLAVMGEFAYSAQGDAPDDKDLDSALAFGSPFGSRVTLVRGFLDIPLLKNIVTDTHFVKRDRMGRLLVFLARLNIPQGYPPVVSLNPVRGIGVDEGAALLLEMNGKAKIVGRGSAYFIEPSFVKELNPHQPFNLDKTDVQKVAPGGSFNLKNWRGDATRYTLSVENGVIGSTQIGGAIY